MKISLPALLLLASVGLASAQSDPSFRMKPTPSLGDGGYMSGCRSGSCKAKQSTPMTPSCSTGMGQARLDYRPLAGDREDLQIIVERLRKIQGNYPQVSRALNEITNLIYHIEDQTVQPLALNPSASSGPRLVLKSPAEGGRPQVRRDSSQPGRHDPSRPQPIVYRGQDLTWSLGGRGDRILSCALNTPQKHIFASCR